MINNNLIKKWNGLLNHENLTPITSLEKKSVVAQLLENQEQDLLKERAATEGFLAEAGTDIAPANVTGNVGKYDPILISLVRRSMPNLIAYDVAGVQPMNGPTGLVFGLRPKYISGNSLGTDAFYNEANSAFSGTGTQTGTNPAVLNAPTPGVYTKGTAMTSSAGELLGSTTGGNFGEMGFEIEKITVTAGTRALKGNYSVELAQDMKNIHGLDAEVELTNILASELLAEINREFIRTLYITAKPGAQNSDLVQAGTFDLDTDSNGRWSVEKFKGLYFQIERDANVIAKETRRGKGNFIICSSDVASALSLAGVLDYAPAFNTSGLTVDDTGNTFAGILNGKYKVYIDPYATGDYYVVGYKGPNAYDAGIIYAPYVPFQLYRVLTTDSFQPRLGFKTRYGLVANNFAQGTTKGNGALNANSNVYYRRVAVTNLTSQA